MIVGSRGARDVFKYQNNGTYIMTRYDNDGQEDIKFQISANGKKEQRSGGNTTSIDRDEFGRIVVFRQELLEELPLLHKYYTRLADLHLSPRAYNVLKAAGARRLGDVAAIKKSSLARVRNCGRNTLQEIIDTLHHNGLTPGTDVTSYGYAPSATLHPSLLQEAEP